VIQGILSRLNRLLHDDMHCSRWILWSIEGLRLQLGLETAVMLECKKKALSMFTKIRCTAGVFAVWFTTTLYQLEIVPTIVMSENLFILKYPKDRYLQTTVISSGIKVYLCKSFVNFSFACCTSIVFWTFWVLRCNK
jgi:hypothetical protein